MRPFPALRPLLFLLPPLLVLLPASALGGPKETLASIGFDPEKLNVFVGLLIFACFFFVFLHASRRGRMLYLRRLPGIDAIEEAVGRATEMGRPVLFIPGIDDIDEIQTLAGIAVLSHVARMTAEYESEIIVPTRRAIVLSVCEETVKQSYSAAGHPDAYKPDNLVYLSDEQFAFTAGVDGIMMRKKPAANLYLGCFYAESLILAETGYANGAIQVAGTAMIPQLPFFITACDYTLIAEEFYAASAYLSKDPKVLSSIKASDYFKVIVILLLGLGVALATFRPDWLPLLQRLF